MNNSFIAGTRWRIKPERAIENQALGRIDPDFDFVIIEKEGYEYPISRTEVVCRLEVKDHTQKCSLGCTHGKIYPYSKTHLKKYAYMVGSRVMKSSKTAMEAPGKNIEIRGKLGTHASALYFVQDSDEAPSVGDRVMVRSDMDPRVSDWANVQVWEIKKIWGNEFFYLGFV